MNIKKPSTAATCFDSEQVREILLSNGLFQTIGGEYIAASVIGRIIPNRKNGTAVCKDKFGNRIAVIRWNQENGGSNGK